MGRVQAALRYIAGIVGLGLCVLGDGALAAPPATTLADGRVGRISFVAPAGNSTLASLVNGTYATGDVIWGDLLMPQQATGPVPAMVISHGSGGLAAASYEWAELFAGMGVAAFVIDHFSGRGFSSTYMDQSLIGNSVVPADALLALRMLATHPRIDARRIGHIGFSKGGNAALVSAYERMRAAMLPDATRFALHLPFYSGGFTTANHVTGAPIRVFAGELDDYTPLANLRAAVEHLRSVGADIELTVYPGAYHALEASYPVTWIPGTESYVNCSAATNIDTLVTIDPRTGLRITNVAAYMEACATRGAHVGMNEVARTQSRQAVWSFVRQQFGLAGIPETVTLPMAGDVNHTALWWNPDESGWGINFNHQGGILFGTLFAYDAGRAPLWLVMSGGRRQGISSTYSGDLFRVAGPPFNAMPFTPITPANVTKVGTMTVALSGANAATLIYSVNGVTVSKAIQRQVYGARTAACAPTTATRVMAMNYQDLWWNPAESGWGVNVTHQDSTLFATLFTYDAGGRPLWLVMSAGVRQADGSYLGDLYRASGPAFDAVPFTGVTLSTVGTMRFRFTDGENGTLSYTYDGVPVTKAITRQVFASPVPLCN